MSEYQSASCLDCDGVSRWINECDLTSEAKKDITSQFFTEEIDGEALLLLEKRDLKEIFKLKLGRRHKLWKFILAFQTHQQH